MLVRARANFFKNIRKIGNNTIIVGADRIVELHLSFASCSQTHKNSQTTMVIPSAAVAARAVGAAGSAGATALGLGMGKSELDLSRNLFKQQMRQTKRLWTADWACASVRHGETIMQAAQHHSEAQAMATASYYQAEKLASQSIKLARDQDTRAYEMSFRSEVRESLRDELGNQNNRFNIIMLCDTVCLGCVFTLVADGSPPENTPQYLVNAYICCLGVSIMLFSISLWGSVVMVRRLHDNTAARLERKLFVESEDLQKTWQQQLARSTPTGAQELYLVHQAYEKWVHEYLDPIGKMSIEMLSIGVVTMFISAGILIHSIYLIDDKNIVGVSIFWTSVIFTCTVLLCMKFSEDRKEKKKEGVYGVSWQDESTIASGPFAKIDKAADELSSSTAVALGSLERVEAFGRREKIERDLCTKTNVLHENARSLREESDSRATIRKEVMNLLTTAAEELDSLPEDLITRTNKILHSTDEADICTADLVTLNMENNDISQERDKYPFSPSRVLSSRFHYPPSSTKEKMGVHPIDAQRLQVSLVSLRKKLGEISHTTLLRLRNTSNEPIRLKSGVQLKDGKYVQSLHASDPNGNPQCFHLYPGTEIPPRTEVLVAARSRGGWFPTSGIAGKLTYTSYDESWTFEVSFRNDLIGNIRRCRVKAYPASDTDENSTEPSYKSKQFWQISKDEYDVRANNEIAISFDALHDEVTKASTRQRQSTLTLKSGFLMKKGRFGLGSQWQQLWCVLTPVEIVFSKGPSNIQQEKISLKYITKVMKDADRTTKNVIEIHTTLGLHYLSTKSHRECDNWIKSILDAVELISNHANPMSSSESQVNSSEASLSMRSVVHPPSVTCPVPFQTQMEDSIECVHRDKKTEILSV